MLHLSEKRCYETNIFCPQKLFLFKYHKSSHRPDLHSLPAGTHIFAEHDVVEGGCTHKEEQLFKSLLDEDLLHAMLGHGGVEETELLNDGGEGVGL